jgi:hypothetical protein
MFYQYFRDRINCKIIYTYLFVGTGSNIGHYLPAAGAESERHPEHQRGPLYFTHQPYIQE